MKTWLIFGYFPYSTNKWKSKVHPKIATMFHFTLQPNVFDIAEPDVAFQVTSHDSLSKILDMINDLVLSVKACGVNASLCPALSHSQLISVSERACISIPLPIFFFLASLLSWEREKGERRGQRWEAKAPVKWFYHGETRAGRGPRLRAEWQAAETIKIEPLSLFARAVLIQAGVQATLIHTHSLTLGLSCGTWTDMWWHGCRHARVHLHLQATRPLCLGLSGLCSISEKPNCPNLGGMTDCTDLWKGWQVDTITEAKKALRHFYSLNIGVSKVWGVVHNRGKTIFQPMKEENVNYIYCDCTIHG